MTFILFYTIFSGISFSAYTFGVFLLAFMGIGSMLYNIQAAASNFEFVLSFRSLVLVVIIPILTMCVLAEEDRRRTDQLSLHHSFPGDCREVSGLAGAVPDSALRRGAISAVVCLVRRGMPADRLRFHTGFLSWRNPDCPGHSGEASYQKREPRL